VFGDVKRLPVLKATVVESDIDLLELAQFATAVFPMLDITTADKAALRSKSNFLPEIEAVDIQEDEEVKPNDTDEELVQDEIEETPEEDSEEAEREFAQIVANAELAHPVAIGKNQPTVTDEDDLIDLDDPEDIERMIRDIARKDPFLGDLLRAEASDE
jgi:hypothetical protein